ncbi:hypothetical protein [Dethiobacter alkaliphilus]|uniref:Uncharacterized protein n=1 Tax=Dethiobacter alkaliphilus AHT 1 TaxID=555088 RepID=C0GIT1_DETAL|nr:hypothetical protein [Dethiobacter alkaliphilus]EEG76745.1 hypothetical protein DealDRAFT_2390 [Dethiobacter alkaliphilus AHT 1]
MDKAVFAFFDKEDKADKAMHQLRDKGYVASVQKVDNDLPDRDLSVSSLMVGFLPDLSSALFETRPGPGAYLLVGVDKQHDQSQAQKIIEEFEGEVLKQK